MSSTTEAYTRIPVSTAVAAGHIREDNNTVQPTVSHVRDATSLFILPSGAKVAETVVQAHPFLKRQSNALISWTASVPATDGGSISWCT